MPRTLVNATSYPEDHGLKFVIDDWNGSIANGAQFSVGWNMSLLEGEAAELYLYAVTYPEDGLVAYAFSSNLTGE